MTARAVMIQGAGSNVGKSLLVAGLCRAFTRRGLKVLPFKPQNMSNNAAVTIEGGEIGRAQALQARACYADPTVHMNPVLLKPETDTGAQIIVQGERFGSMRAREYGSHKASLMPKVLDSFTRLKADADLVIIEGAGSPAEVNLRAGDIANMGFAEAADVPVVLVGDIDRGGVIAALVGTANVLEPEETARIKGFLINKFRGDTSLFHDGMTIIEDATGWQGLGILPWFDRARTLPAEDILDLTSKADRGDSGGGDSGGGVSEGLYHVAVPVLRRIANFDDLDPLVADPAVKLTLVDAGDPLPLDADMVLLPGSKSTIADLAFLRQQGWDIDLMALMRHGAKIVGLCGGYQMLGRRIHDPDGLEGAKGSVDGLGLLDIETTLEDKKTVTFSDGVEQSTGEAVSGYEIHLGRTTGEDCARPMVRLDAGHDDGAVSADGRVMGCYMHGLFGRDGFRSAWLKSAGQGGSDLDFDATVEDGLNALADHLARHADLDAIARIAGIEG
ncbi:MAG: cobyric acid synthase [Alphaproteobacteria bacterium]|nr:cobyric acid synthase [Alphaproteobacteria bacterium]